MSPLGLGSPESHCLWFCAWWFLLLLQGIVPDWGMSDPSPLSQTPPL